MTDEEMWRAVVRSDGRYDGRFYYAVKTTGIFCRPSCRSKPPRRENVVYFKTARQALAAGFRPCKRCRSDLAEYQPLRQIAEEAKQRIDSAEELDDSRRWAGAGLTPRRQAAIFKQEYGLTPKAYSDTLRLERAKAVLTETEEKIIDVAAMAGFSSLSAFNRFFKKQTGLTPSAYRKAAQKRQ